MNGIEAGDVLRIAVISGLIGFGVFCASYSLSVWFRRNKSRPNSLARYSFMLMILGMFAVASNWAYNEYTQRNGIVGGQDLFVVHAKRNVTTDKLAPEGHINQGDRLVEFIPPSMEGQLAVIDSHIKQSQAKIQHMALQALPVDSMLLQRQAQIRTQIDQAKTFQYDLQKSRREIEKSQNDLQNQLTKERSLLEVQVSGEREAVASAQEQITIAQNASARAAELRKSGIGTLATVEEKSAILLTHSLMRNRSRASIGSLEAYRVALNARYEAAAKSLEYQQISLAKDLAAVRNSLVILNAKLEVVEKAVLEDRDRANSATRSEKEALEHELEALRAERVSVLAVTQVKSPFTGEVVYRHPAPGFAPENTPVLAVSSGSGFVASVWMPTQEIESIKSAGKVQFALEQSVLNKFFVGEFRSLEEAPYEKNKVIAKFDAKLPLDAITMLASAGNPVQVRLLWRPDLLESLPFQISLGATAAGFCGVMASAMRRSTANDKESVQMIQSEALDLRLHEMARDFHILLRGGRLNEDVDLVRGVLKIVDRVGDPALNILREELVFDDELELMIATTVDQPHILDVLNRVRGRQITLVS